MPLFQSTKATTLNLMIKLKCVQAAVPGAAYQDKYACALAQLSALLLAINIATQPESLFLQKRLTRR